MDVCLFPFVSLPIPQIYYTGQWYDACVEGVKSWPFYGETKRCHMMLLGNVIPRDTGFVGQHRMVNGSSLQSIKCWKTHPLKCLDNDLISGIYPGTNATAATCDSSTQRTVTPLITMHNLEQRRCMLHSHFPVIEYNLLMKKKRSSWEKQGRLPRSNNPHQCHHQTHRRIMCDNTE